MNVKEIPAIILSLLFKEYLRTLDRTIITKVNSMMIAKVSKKAYVS